MTAQAIKTEIERQMSDAQLAFNVESVEDKMDALDDTAEYIEMIYADEETVPDKVAAWIEDTRTNHPQFFRQI